MFPERFRNFLLGQAKADHLRHSGRSLYDHLCGTHDLLRGFGASPDVCTAGLFHSIYGTRHFRKAAWPLDDRAMIRFMIGDEAEFLVYLFAVTDRPKALLTRTNSLRDHHTGDMLILWPRILRDLREIEAANLIDQGGGRWLKALHETDISAAAKQAIARHLEANDGLERRHGGERRTGGR